MLVPVDDGIQGYRRFRVEGAWRSAVGAVEPPLHVGDDVDESSADGAEPDLEGAVEGGVVERAIRGEEAFGGPAVEASEDVERVRWLHRIPSAGTNRIRFYGCFSAADEALGTGRQALGAAPRALVEYRGRSDALEARLRLTLQATSL